MLLRAHILGSANDGAHLGHRFIPLQRSGNAEIHQHSGAVATKHDVIRLDVAVNDVLFACIIQGSSNLGDDPFDVMIVEAVLQSLL